MDAAHLPPRLAHIPVAGSGLRLCRRRGELEHREAKLLGGRARRKRPQALRRGISRRLLAALYRKLPCDAPRDAASPATVASPACSRHYYEIIREGNPCHLHLDLEFATASNLAADGERMVATLRHELLGAPNTHYSVPTTHHSLRTTHHSLRATHHSPLTTTTHTIHYPLPMTHDPPGALVDLALALALALARPSPSPKSSSNSNPLALARTPTPTLTRCARRQLRRRRRRLRGGRDR